MKKLFFIMLVALSTFSCSKDEDNENILDKNVEGKNLTEKFCINLVRNHWDCNMGARYGWDSFGSTHLYAHYSYGCSQGDMGKITSNIQDFFDTGIDTEKSYYKNYILYLRISNSDETYISYIEVAF